MHKIVLLLLAQALGTFAFAQEAILKGEIRDVSDTPIPQALVAIEGSKIGVYTDNNGIFTLNISPGKHTVTVSAYGFKLKKVAINIQSNKTLNFALEKLEIDIKSVNVYGKTKSQQLREGAFTVNSLEVKNIASSLSNVNTLIGRSSGIIIRENGGIGADFDLSINGLSGNSIRYFIDGIPISSMGHSVSLANIPVNIIDRVEVYKGVVPAYLGCDALGGAINIITKKNANNYLDASYGIGSFYTHKADFNAQYVNKRTGTFIRPSVGFNYSKNNYMMKGVEILNNGTFRKANSRRFHDDYLSFLSQLKIGLIDKKWTDLFSVSASYFNSDKELQSGSVQSRVYGMATRKSESFSISSEYLKNKFLVTSLSLNMYLSHTWDNKTVTDTAFHKYYWDGPTLTNTGRNEITGGAKSIKHINRPLTVGRVHFNYVMHSNHVFNLNYLFNHLTNNRYDDLDSDFEPSKDYFNKNIIGISYNQTFWHNRLVNTLFIKDYISHLIIGQTDLSWLTGSDAVAKSSTTNNWGYGLSSRLRFSDKFSIKGSLEHSVRLPLAREYLGNGVNVNPNFTLVPENSNNNNLGLYGTFQINSNHSLSYETGYFYRKVEDYIRLVITESEGTSQYDNVSNVTVKGIEGEIRYKYNNLFQAIVNGSYLDERNKTKYQNNGKPDISYNNRMPNRPWLFGNLELNFRKKDVFGLENNQLKIAYYFQYVHWFYLTWEGYAYEPSKSKIPTQYLNNVQLTYALKNEKYNISLECNNIFNRTVYDNYKMQKPGRFFFCKLRLFIN